MIYIKPVFIAWQSCSLLQSLLIASYFEEVNFEKFGKADRIVTKNVRNSRLQGKICYV